MPVSYSANRIRNAELHKAWDELPDDHFAERGITRDDVKNLQSELQGHIVLPGDPDYNKDRMLTNPVFNYFPVMIVYCYVESDVSTVLAYVRGQKKPFEVRSGGHCTAGFSSGPGVLIDVSNLNSIVIDAVARTAVVGCGTRFGHLNDVLNRYNLHVPGGECPDVCVGGYVQGGGYGFTSVTLGMNCDNVIALTVLLADGSVVEASQAINSDLYWAMLGGTGGNFGILLKIEYHLHVLGNVFGFALIWPLANEIEITNAAAVMTLLQDQYMLNSRYTPNLNIQVSLCYQSRINPNNPKGPLKPYFMVRGLYVGTEADGLAAIKALQAMPGGYTQWTLVRRYNDMNDMLLNYPDAMPPLTSIPFEDKASRYVQQNLTIDQWAQILAYFLRAEVNTAYMYLEFYGGRINAAMPDLNAFVHRDVLYNAVMDVFWYEDKNRPAAEQFLQGWKDMMEPVWNGHVYQNYPSLDTENYAFEYWRNVIWVLTLAKEKFDPNNLFTFAQQIPGFVVDRQPEEGDWEMPQELQEALNREIDYTGGIKPDPLNQ